MKDIDVSYKAAKIITSSAKFFLAKKNYYIIMLKLYPKDYENNTFMNLLK